MRPMLKSINALIGQRSVLRLAWHKGKALLAALRYGFPARSLTVIGITGTDGKTTTVGMLAQILSACGKRVGAASTAFLQINDLREENATHLTSISPFTLQKFLRKLVRMQCKFAVIEMSSHGLVQGRTDWTFPSIAGITNTALEHLDYHGTMEQYRKDKGILFMMLRGNGTKVLNADDESYEQYRSIRSKETITFGDTESDLFVSEIAADATGSSAKLHANDGIFALKLNIPGTYNLQNALCAIGCAQAAGIATADAAMALATFCAIPGRMERIDEGQEFSVFVDFAVSPQSYEKTLQALRAMVGGNQRVLVLCGSCGNRMREKRPEIGRICSTLADVVVVTEDETYGEDPKIPWEEVWSGIDQTACEAHKVFDRKEAITFLLAQAMPGDAVVLCGMGPFSTFTKLEGRIPWDEREIAREILRSIQ